MMGSLKSAGSMASSVMAAGIQRVGEKVRALSGSTGKYVLPIFLDSHFCNDFSPIIALSKQDLHTVLNVPTTDDHIVTQNNSIRSGSAEKTIPEQPEHHHHKVNFHQMYKINFDKFETKAKISPFLKFFVVQPMMVCYMKVNRVEKNRNKILKLRTLNLHLLFAMQDQICKKYKYLKPLW